MAKSFCSDCVNGPNGKLPECRLCSAAHAAALRRAYSATTARLRDVAAAAQYGISSWRDLAEIWDETFAARIRVPGEWDDQPIEGAIDQAVYYRGLLSLCEAE